MLSPEPPATDSPQASLVHSALPLLKPSVSGYKQNYVHWPLKRLSESPDISLWQTETLVLFTAGCWLGSLLALVLWAGEPCLVFRPYTSHREPPPTCPLPLKYPSGTLAAAHGSPASSHLSALPTSHVLVKWFLSVHCYKASVQLVFTWLFRMISLHLVVIPDWSWE